MRTIKKVPPIQEIAENIKKGRGTKEVPNGTFNF